ncbi:MAG: ABC transporter ATP-binding protein [Burkholderiales bacterium]|nr:ABC transporter ATP-binding protein [Burkholderiales bacterium]
MGILRIDGLSVRFGAVAALNDVHLDVADGEFFCIVGPTNAGKTTLLKTVAGLHRPTAGTVWLNDRNVDGREPRDRKVSLLFQNNALFPDRTGFDNIAFALRTRGASATDIEHRVQEVATQLGVTHLLDRLPRTFSGGEQQRVAIGRAIADHSDLLLLDEPLSSLDARLRTALRLQFKHIGRDRARGILYVTHDHVEAMSLADRIAVLHAGRIQQIGTPDEIYHRPVNRFVAEFFGSPPMNILDAGVVEEGGRLRLAGAGFQTDAPLIVPHAALPRSLQIGVRGEDIRVATVRSESTPNPARVIHVERLGRKHVLDVEIGTQRVRVVTTRNGAHAAGGTVWIGFTPQPQHFLDRDSGLFLR